MFFLAERRAKAFLGVLYPDSTSYMFAAKVALVQTVFDEWAFILHDHDSNEDGTLKKAHLHWVGRFANQRELSTVARKLDLPEHDIEVCKSWKKAVRYLVHLDDSEKFQYSHEAVTANFELERYFVYMDDSSKSHLIFDYIVSERCTSPIQLAGWALQNGVYDALRRGSALWFRIMEEVKAEDFQKRG